MDEQNLLEHCERCCCFPSVIQYIASRLEDTEVLLKELNTKLEESCKCRNERIACKEEKRLPSL
jgi:hypothetical protein